MYTPYDPNSPTAKTIDAARKRNRRRSAIEQSNGFASPEETAPSEHLRTAICAFVAGLDMWSNRDEAQKCIAEGIAMLQDIETRMEWENPTIRVAEGLQRGRRHDDNPPSQ